MDEDIKVRKIITTDDVKITPVRIIKYDKINYVINIEMDEYFTMSLLVELRSFTDIVSELHTALYMQFYK